ncbi:hypothetical protein, conserved [Eimeria tenella]|uniref:Uncharacterized protein n=1 Tax=Eimeria tenella TaxID=5802 RepID=U6KWZ7_EIMTE|nr:hypothetical protein, conserved [Eimeria tenella]CDJ40020.1 hypothetical protein, conserved [Eimeria tenella]|eukprot:XP_013230773.1 hypothetical protein, conserved [Eimeria tenella]
MPCPPPYPGGPQGGPPSPAGGPPSEAGGPPECSRADELKQLVRRTQQEVWQQQQQQQETLNALNGHLSEAKCLLQRLDAVQQQLQQRAWLTGFQLRGPPLGGPERPPAPWAPFGSLAAAAAAAGAAAAAAAAAPGAAAAGAGDVLRLRVQQEDEVAAIKMCYRDLEEQLEDMQQSLHAIARAKEEAAKIHVNKTEATAETSSSSSSSTAKQHWGLQQRGTRISANTASSACCCHCCCCWR